MTTARDLSEQSSIEVVIDVPGYSPRTYYAEPTEVRVWCQGRRYRLILDPE